MNSRDAGSKYAHMEDNRDPHFYQNTSTFLDSLCFVCKSVSSGVHYGVPTCEGCKGFFKRSIRSTQRYHCYVGNNCDVTKDNRNRCKSCRFQRCLQVGMALEATKAGRVTKEKSKRAQKLVNDRPKDNKLKSPIRIAPAPLQLVADMVAPPLVPSVVHLAKSSSGKPIPSCIVSTSSMTRRSPPSNFSSQKLSLEKSNSSATKEFFPKTENSKKRKFLEDSAPIEEYASARLEENTSTVSKMCHEKRSPSPEFLSKDETFSLPEMSPFQSNENLFEISLNSQRNSETFLTTDDDLLDNSTQSITPPSSSTSAGFNQEITNPLNAPVQPESPRWVNMNLVNEFGRSSSLDVYDRNFQSKRGSNLEQSRIVIRPSVPNVPNFSNVPNVPDSRTFTNIPHVSNSRTFTNYDQNEIPVANYDFGPTLEQCMASRNSEKKNSGTSGSPISDAQGSSLHGSFTSLPLAASDEYRTRSVVDSGYGSRPVSVMTGVISDDRSDDGISFNRDSSTARPESRGQNHITRFSSAPQFSGPSEPNSSSRPTSQIVGNFAADPTGIDRRAYWLLIPRVADVDLEQIHMLQKIIMAVEQAGHDVYGMETLNSVDFMVRRWQEGRLRPDSPIGSDPMTALRIRDSIKKNINLIIHNIINFSAKIPGFSGLRDSDVRILIYHCHFEIWLVQSAAFLVNNQSYLLLPSDRDGDQEPTHYSRYWMGHFLSQSMIDSIMTFADEINSLQLSFLELHLLKALIIVCPDRPGLKDVKSIAELKFVLQKALFQAFKRRQTPSPDEMYQKVSHLMPHLDRLNKLNQKHIEVIDLDRNQDGDQKTVEYFVNSNLILN